ncbi:MULTISPECIES: sulfotransferase family protein [Mycobacterium]|uniref:Sulfotransferase n=1 Tax=Mycobacterium kiyosense TaxID=2871094 RepID=A0A9P3Q301_9MYCO|nr:MULTISPECIES: sulfotransferase [Mycobacterium]BDB44071.1 putative sulfotransferase [Mycobacterium kiyosense]BDE15607.1 putative sulfotransferase [Mycobacterium sp. 20KCMC460]GLB80970.1 putative sulfotransferase [Mycobacterium kiyosense]GLB87270.1 putative sulfotransferase [Mycobacterium kiyosense]GLB93450.1 putative sulfotransferase [Mycobacterium kiyosense]
MLKAQSLLNEARTMAGLDDYGDMQFADGMAVLIKSINDEAGLTPQYEEALKEELLRVLVNRLRMNRDLQLHPEIADEEVLPPVYITSMPRTGSTKLHRMLAATGDFNALLYWQSLNFAPFPDADPDGPDPRIEAGYRHLAHVSAQAPGFQRAHPMFAEEAEEELSLLDAGFNSLYTWAALLDVPTYIEYVLRSSPLAAFEDMRRTIQYIQWQHYRGLGRRWVFKTPSMFGFEGAYSAVFTGTDFIVTHRHPLQTVASMCNLMCGSRSKYSDADFTAVAGETMIHNFAEAQKGHLAWRATYPEPKTLDLRFNDITSDEIGVAKAVYDFLGMELTERAIDNIEAWLAMDAGRNHQPCRDTLADYNVEASFVETSFAPYIDRYEKYL